MVRLYFTTDDPHDALTRALSIFRVMDLPILGFEGGYGGSKFQISIQIGADSALADSLLDRLSRLVSVRDARVQFSGANGCESAGLHVDEGARILEQAAA